MWIVKAIMGKAMAAFGLAAMAVATEEAVCPTPFSPQAGEGAAGEMQLAPSAHQLNVVYFVGCDSEPLPGYGSRLSGLLLYVQQFYGREMARNGFGKRSFGLPMDEGGNVSVLLVRGKLPAAEYAYGEEGTRKCLDEVNDFLRRNPAAKRSRHTLVFMPTLRDSRYSDKNPGGVPFGNMGTVCFALDYPGFDISRLGNDSEEGRLAAKWLGGLAHELGHGLNLPHNNGPASLNAALGMPLMNDGNLTFGIKPTYLTPASAAVLDRSETFAVQGDMTDFYADAGPLPQVKDVKMEFDGQTLQIVFRCLGECAHVNAYVQDAPCQRGEDFDAVSFAGAVIGASPGELLLAFAIPRAELKSLRSDTQCLEFLFVAENGCRCRWNMELKWSDVKPGPVAAPSSFVPARVDY